MSQRSYIIGIAGGSGSGKTSFVAALKEAYTSDQLCFISLDDYYRSRDKQLTDENGVKNFDLPESIKADELVDDLRKLSSGETITKVKYTFNNAEAEEVSMNISSAPILIIEGLFIYHYEALKNKFDLKLYIDARDELKLIRRIKRDKTERNYPLEDVIYRYEHHVMPSYRKYIGKYKDQTDLIINNNQDFTKGLKVVKVYIDAILKG